MPGWHKRTEKFVAAGQLAVAGIVQEQHGDRAALYMQWQRMDWPVMVDSLNLLGIRSVPITLLIDELGIIRAVNPDGGALERFIATDFPATGARRPPTFKPDNAATSLAIAAVHSVEGIGLGPAIAALAKHIAAHPEDAEARFRLGVLHRKRLDSSARVAADFSAAIDNWIAALKLDPGQYIWRRRIQQYGPRLDKPYPFYDWVPLARREVAARGDTPQPLVAEPGDAEIARPSKNFGIVSGAEHPDPEAKLPIDTMGLIGVRSTLVPSTDASSPGYRIHVEFTPSAEKLAHWNNESGVSDVWLKAPAGWEISPSHLLLKPPPAPEASSSERRTIEFELRPATRGKVQAGAGSVEISAMYYVCEGAEGTCQYLRSNATVKLPPLPRRR